MNWTVKQTKFKLQKEENFSKVILYEFWFCVIAQNIDWLCIKVNTVDYIFCVCSFPFGFCQDVCFVDWTEKSEQVSIPSKYSGKK